ncbi:MAG: hypothetical protein V1694_01260 [Candidatus Eisenbacteria bacterium]
MPSIFRIVRGLIEETHYRQIESSVLLDKWLSYAPCGINEGPIFIRRTDSDLVEVLKSVPLADGMVIRDHLSGYFDVKDVPGGECQRPLKVLP